MKEPMGTSYSVKPSGDAVQIGVLQENLPRSKLNAVLICSGVSCENVWEPQMSSIDLCVTKL